jgi:DNA-binding transcriptional ArsR family regulator
MSLGDDRAKLRALAHPLRVRILSLLTGAAMSSAELARELGMTHAAVSFHVRRLAAAGYLELAEVRSVRGGQERRYRTRVAGRAEWEQEDPRLAVRAVSEEVARRAASSSTDAWRVFADAEAWVEQDAWDAFAEKIGEAVRELDRRALPPRTAGSIHVSATALLFAIDDTAAAPTPAPARRRTRAPGARRRPPEVPGSGA